MAMPGIAVILGKKPEGDDKMGDSKPMMAGDDDYGDLSPKEIVEHQMSAMEAFMEACAEKRPGMALKAFRALHRLDHAAMDEGEEAPVVEDQDEASNEEK